ncbi:MAG: T9SS type A sorting domain-containing protein [Ignavibacteria bacterium]|nr:T9SS type A sorting domain-containing protein [Ignavibacteria bacterium]
MEKIFLLTVFVILNFTFCIGESYGQWMQCYGIYGGFVQSFAKSGDNIFAGVRSFTSPVGVFLTSNNGRNWSQTAFNNQPVYSLAISGNIIFAGTWTNGVYQSTNNGQNWTQTALNDHLVYSLAVNGNYIFAGTGAGVYVSTNNGQNWSITSLNISTLSLEFSENNSEDSEQVIYAGTHSNGLYLSSNYGQSWVQAALNNHSIHSLAINGNNIFAGTFDGLYYSTNNGQNWIESELINLDFWALELSGINIFAGTWTDGVYYSSNNGQNWIQLNQGFNGTPSVISFLITDNSIFAGTYDNSIWRRPLSEIIGIEKISTEVPSAFSLGQNYPNPFNSVTSIKFKVTSASPYPLQRGTQVVLRVFDLMGREVRTLVDEELQAGVYEVRFDAGDLPSGIYFYRMETENFTETRKLILLK